MADKTEIEWAEATLNAWTGCRKVSAGCAHCYIDRTPALRIPGRKFVRGQTLYVKDGEVVPGQASPVVYHLDRIDKMVRHKKPTLYFVNSLSDVFLEDVPDEAIALLFAGMAMAPQHTFQVLTKRPERMRELLNREDWHMMVARQVWDMEAKAKHGESYWHRTKLARYGPPMARAPEGQFVMPHVWLGVTVENRAQVKRADVLRGTPAAVRFLSCEPLLGPLVHDCWRAQGGMLVPGPGHYREGVDEPAVPARSAWLDERLGGPRRPQLDLSGIDWMIAGGESGPGARPCREEWLRDLRDACQAESWRRIGGPGPCVGELAERPEPPQLPGPCWFFLKQLGGHPDKRGKDAAVLDGERHTAMPPVHAAA